MTGTVGSVMPDSTVETADRPAPRRASRGRLVPAAIAAVVIAVVGVVVARSRPSPLPPAPTSGPAQAGAPAQTGGPPTAGAEATTAPSPESCRALMAAAEGSTVTLSGELACEASGLQPGVTLTGSYSGWLRLHKPDRWTVRDLVATKGDGRAVLQILGGSDWTVADSTLSSEGGPGPYGVLDVGESQVDGNPTNWRIQRVNVTAAVINPLYEGNQNTGVYVIGQAGKPMNGLIEESTIIGGAAGPALKLGGTGKTVGATDGVSDVTVRRNTIVGQNVPTNECAIKIVTSSEDLRIDANTIDCRNGGDPITLGTYFGGGTTVTNNTFVMPADRANWMAGTNARNQFIAYAFGECPNQDLRHPLGPELECSGNTRRTP